VIKDALLQSDPGLAAAVYQAFVAAKEPFMERLRAGASLSPDEAALANRRSVVGDDPLPYGLAPNGAALQALARFAYEQQIVSRPIEPETLFVNDGYAPRSRSIGSR